MLNVFAADIPAKLSSGEGFCAVQPVNYTTVLEKTPQCGLRQARTSCLNTTRLLAKSLGLCMGKEIHT